MPNLEMFRRADNMRHYAVGETIYSAGEPGHDMLVIVDGTVEVIVGERVLRTLGAGEIIGEMALIDDDHVRAATVRAASDVQVAPVDARQFEFLLRNHPNFGREVMKTMADRLRYMNDLART